MTMLFFLVANLPPHGHMSPVGPTSQCMGKDPQKKASIAPAGIGKGVPLEIL